MELNEIMELFEKHEAQEYARGFDVGKGYGYKKGYDAGCRDRDKIKEYEQTADEIKVEYDEETRSYTYTVDSSSEKPNKSAHKIRKDGVRVPICSNCYMRLDERWNYCPHCGSKLEEGEAE